MYGMWLTPKVVEYMATHQKLEFRYWRVHLPDHRRAAVPVQQQPSRCSNELVRVFQLREEFLNPNFIGVQLNNKGFKAWILEHIYTSDPW